MWLFDSSESCRGCSGVADFAAGSSATIARTAAGIYTWGYNGNGELGLGNTTTTGCWCISEPTPVPGFSTPPPLPPRNAVAIPGNQEAHVEWLPPTSISKPLTGYVVHTYDDSGNILGAPVTVCASCSNAYVTGLTNGVNYHFGVSSRIGALSSVEVKSLTIQPSIALASGLRFNPGGCWAAGAGSDAFNVSSWRVAAQSWPGYGNIGTAYQTTTSGSWQVDQTAAGGQSPYRAWDEGSWIISYGNVNNAIEVGLVSGYGNDTNIFVNGLMPYYSVDNDQIPKSDEVDLSQIFIQVNDAGFTAAAVSGRNGSPGFARWSDRSGTVDTTVPIYAPQSYPPAPYVVQQPAVGVVQGEVTNRSGLLDVPGATTMGGYTGETFRMSWSPDGKNWYPWGYEQVCMTNLGYYAGAGNGGNVFENWGLGQIGQ